MKRPILGLLPVCLSIAVGGACSGAAETAGSGAGGAPSSSNGNTTASGDTSSNASGTGSSSSGGTCTEGEQTCSGTSHLICQNGAFTEAPCPEGQGCDEATGACIPCVCDPSDPPTCLDLGTVATCNEACTGQDTSPCSTTQSCNQGVCVEQLCIPGSFNCLDDATYEVCNSEGSGYDPGGTCDAKEQCSGSEGCLPLCDIIATAPSSVGCSFFALNMDNFNEGNPDAIVIGNPSETLTAITTLYSSYGGVEQVLQANVQIPPKSLNTFTLPNGNNDVIEGTGLRTGGAFRVESDIPVIGYQHSPLLPQATNDASCLLPEATLGSHHVVGTYTDALNGYPSYVTIIGTQATTSVTVTVPVTTDAGSGVPSIGANQAMTFTLNRYDTLQIAATSKDMTGTDVLSDKPVAVFGAVECAQVPAGATYCDHMEEQSLPVRNWGKVYVGAHAPKRSGSERYYWRVLGQQGGTTINTTPTQTGFPITLDAGQFYDFWTKTSFVFDGDKPFAAFQYVSGQNDQGAGTGDPAMMTAVPVEQFLKRYVLLTPTGYSNDYVQIIRSTPSDVFVDGVAVPANLFSAVGQFEVADYPVSSGVHSLESIDPFGIMGVGYTGVTSYAYPGGMALIDLGP